MMNNYNSLSLGFSSYLKKWSSSSVGSPPTITVHEKQKVTQSFGVMSFMFFALVFLGLFSSNAIAQTTVISGLTDGSFESADLSTDGWQTSQTATNAWVTGTAAGATHGTRAAYINSTGTTGGPVSYNNVSSQANHIYRDFTYPVGEDIGTITFDLKGAPADIGFDRITVYVCATTVFPVAGTEAPVGTVQVFRTDAAFAAFTTQTVTFTKGQTGGTSTARIIITWRDDTTDGVLPYAIDKFNLVTSTPTTYTASAFGGLWNSPATWVGGVVPPTGNNVSIPNGSIVTINQIVTVGNMTINGTLQWGNTAFALTLGGNLLINPTGRFLTNTTAVAGNTINIAGNYQNDGFANHVFSGVTFNGAGSTLSGSGVFAGKGGKGIFRTLNFTVNGSNTISTSQNLIVIAGIAATAGSLNTNGKVELDNTQDYYGLLINRQVSNIGITNMGSLYTTQPVVFGSAVTQWDNITGVVNTLYTSGGNVYRCTAAANIGPSAPTHDFTTAISQNLLWIGTVNTLGNPFQFNTSVTVGTQVFYGDNLYVCTVAGIPSSAAPPTHLSGTAVSGAATFRYAGSPAKASANFDVVTGTVRSLNLLDPGTGYSSAPAIAFSVGNLAGTGSGAAATAVFVQQVNGSASSLIQKSAIVAISGGLTINSDQGADASAHPQSSSGVGNISTSNGGVNYTVAPTVGFAGPPALNLITNAGSGYLAVPTVTVTGGTLVSGTALTTANFTINVNAGIVESVYLNTATTATYSVPPTLTLTASPGVTATLAFPAGCWPAATANIGPNGQLTSFTMTNAGFGYAAAPIVGVGTTSGTAEGGTFTTVATAPTARIALYNLTLNFFSPAPSAPTQLDDVNIIPANRKINTLSLNGNGNGLTLTNKLTLFGTAPLALVASLNTPGNILDMGGFDLNFTWNGYGGTFATVGASNAYIKNGTMSVTGRGGASTFNFPFAGTLSWFAGSTPTAAISGNNVTRVTVSEVIPTNATPGNALPVGPTAYKVHLGSGTVGTNPQVTLRFTALDALTVTQDNLFVADAAVTSGPWSIRSAAFGASGALPVAGSLITATVAPGPIVPLVDSYYAWATPIPVVNSFSPLSLCASSGTFTISGANFNGVTAVTIGGTPVSSFVVVSNTQITGVAGIGTNGFVAVTKGAITTTGIENITVLPSPIVATVTPASATVNLGGTASFTASGSETTFNWYAGPVGGAPIFTGATYSTFYCATTTIYVAQSNGSCEGPRVARTITVNPSVVTASTASFCSALIPAVVPFFTTLDVTPISGTITYTWTSLTPSAAFVGSNIGNSVDVNVVETSDFQVVAAGPNGCTTTSYISIGVYGLPVATVTASAQGVCPGTSATINSGLVAGNFISNPITFAPLTAPGTATTLATGGVATPALTSGSLDDGGWGAIPMGFNFSFFGTTYSTINIGTNATVQFGTYSAAGLGDFTFTTLPSATEPLNMLALLAMDNDLRTGSGSGTIKYWTQGYAPNRRFVISYEAVQEYGDAKFSTVQAIFYETTGLIEVHVTSSTNVDRVKLVGVNNGTGTIGALAYNSGTVVSANPQNPISNPFAYRFTPPYNFTTNWTADEGEGPFEISPNSTNVFSLAVSPLVTTTYTISYTNQTTGCANALNSAQVTMTILGNTAPIGVNTLASLNPVCPGSSTNLSLSYAGSTDGLTFQWQQDTGSGYTDILGATTATYIATPVGPTSYKCRIRSCGNVPGQSFSTPVAITLNNVVIASSTGYTRCGAGPVTVSASGSGTQVGWYAAATGGTALFTGSTWNIANQVATQTYYVASEVTSPSFCSGIRVPVVVTVNAAPPLTISSSLSSVCAGATTSLITLTSTPGDYASYNWSPTTGVSGSAGAGWTITPTATTTYTLTGSNPNPQDCLKTATYTVTVNALAPTPLVTSSSPTYTCGGTGVLLSVGLAFTNPTPGTACLFLNATTPQWPTNTVSATACDGTTSTVCTTVAFAGEYSKVNVTSALYTFTSAIGAAHDKIAITSEDGLTTYAWGTSPLTWINNVAAPVIRFYTQHANDDCLGDGVSRTRSFVCTSAVTATFSPTTGLYTDAAGTTAYTGNAVGQVYAFPATPQTYSVVSNNASNCPSNAATVPVGVNLPCYTKVNLKLFIEGYYDTTAPGTMRSVKLNQDGVSPADEVEAIIVELHDSVTYATVATTNAELKTNGTANCTFITSPSGSYYVAVKTSNAVQTWSATAQTVGPILKTYDFSTAANKAYGDNMLSVGGVFCFYSGDINQDEVVDNTDAPDLIFSIDNSDFGVQVTDLNGDGAVDNSDAPFFENNAANSIFAIYPF